MDADETDTQGALLNLRDPATALGLHPATALGLHLPRTLYRRVEDGAPRSQRPVLVPFLIHLPTDKEPEQVLRDASRSSKQDLHLERAVSSLLQRRKTLTRRHTICSERGRHLCKPGRRLARTYR